MHELVGIRPVETGGDLNVAVEVIDSVSLYGPKLVRLRAPDAVALNASYLGWKVRPVVYYKLEAAPSFELNSAPACGNLTVNLSCARTGQAVEGAEVIAVTDWTNHVGAKAVSNGNGEV